MDLNNKDARSSEIQAIEKIKEAADYLRQALILMCQVDGCQDASEDIKNKIKKIVSAFSIDKSELEMIIDSYNKR